MSFGQVMFSFQDRIGRGKFWLGVLMIVLLAIVGMIIAAFLVPWDRLVEVGADGQPVLNELGQPKFNVTFNDLLPALGVYAVFYIPMLWISLATGVKRAHDRNKSGWWLLLLAPSTAGALYTYYLLYRSGGDMLALMTDPTYLTVQTVTTLVGLAAGIWWLVDLGILEGTKGDNRFGPDPLAGKSR